MKINTITIKNSYPADNKIFVHSVKSPSLHFTGNNTISFPNAYYRNMFEGNKNISIISFNGLPHETKMEQLKKSLTEICEETITRYNQHEEAVSQNLFTRGFIQHSFDFTPKEGDDFHNLRDPFRHEEWSSYYNSRHKTTADGATLSTIYSKKMEDKINSWIQEFIKIISKEKAEGKNNLLDDLLAAGNDLQKIKNMLGLG